MPKHGEGPTPVAAYGVLLAQIREAREAAMVAARVIDAITGRMRERVVAAKGYTMEQAADFERLAEVSAALAMVSVGEPVPKLLREPRQ